MAKILLSIKNPLTRNVIWSKNMNLFLEGFIFPNVWAMDLFFHNFNCWRYEALKMYMSLMQDIFSIVYETLKCLKSTYLQQVKSWKKKVIARSLGQIQPSKNRFQLLHQITTLGTKAIQSWQNLHHCPKYNQLFNSVSYILQQWNLAQLYLT